MNERQIPYELLAKYLSRQCTQAELEEVNRWLNEDAEHPLLLEKLKRQWEAVQVDASVFVIPFIVDTCFIGCGCYCFSSRLFTLFFIE